MVVYYMHHVLHTLGHGTYPGAICDSHGGATEAPLPVVMEVEKEPATVMLSLPAPPSTVTVA